jgi:DMSO/TMAO reductase YedYZ molybdopterin-dependent catalytic subunit
MPLSRRRLLALAAGAPALTLAGADRPKRNMIALSTRPEDYEMPLDGFLEEITPVDRFFVRSHHYTPDVDLKDWALEVTGSVEKPLKLSLDELKKMPRAELTAVLECAGNGRGFYEPSMPGLQWKYGAVGNARWAGVRLAEVLKRAGVKPGAVEALFDGCDEPVGAMPKFQRGVPLRKALDPNTILAYEMNGEPLPRSHGFPLRVVAAGWAGDCWMKWLKRIEVRDTEFDGFFMKTAYRHPGKAVAPGLAVDPAQMTPVTSLRVKSVIARVENAAVGRRAEIRGAAWSGDASPVAAVEVSVDAGRSWRPARIVAGSGFGFRIWSFDWTPVRAAYYTVMARARTASGETQPLAQEWNPSGYYWNVVHSVAVNLGSPVSAEPVPAPALEPPAGYRSACLICHDEAMMSGQRLNPAQWEREVDKMIRWGAPVKPEHREGIVRYLVTRFGPRKL